MKTVFPELHETICVGILQDELKYFEPHFNLFNKFKINYVMLSINNIIADILIFSGLYPDNSYRDNFVSAIQSALAFYKIDITKDEVERLLDKQNRFEEFVKYLRKKFGEKLYNIVEKQIFALKPFVDLIIIYDLENEDEFKKLNLNYLLTTKRDAFKTYYICEHNPEDSIRWLIQDIVDPLEFGI